MRLVDHQYDRALALAHDVAQVALAALGLLGNLHLGTVTGREIRSEEHTSELQSLMRISYAVFCLKKKITTNTKKRSRTHLKTNYYNIRSKAHKQKRQY